MRRVLTFLTAAVLLLVSLAVGVFTADLPFWRRAFQLPLAADAAYLPAAIIGIADANPGTNAASSPPTIDPLVIEEAASRARAAGSRALLVMHDGRLEIERYFVADDARTLLPAALVARPAVAMAIGIALADHSIPSLDTHVSHFLPEWSDEPRGRITLRQLLEETSGLETGGDLHGILYRSPWERPGRLAEFATSKGVRMLLGNDFESTALGFRLEHEPGGFYNFSPANSQLAAVIIERATHLPFEKFVDERLWRAVGGGIAELQLDRRAGMPAAHCCWRATARDMMRVLSLLGSDGVYDGRAVLPAGWAAEMARPSRVHAETGLQIARVDVDGNEALHLIDDNGSEFWIVPRRRLAVLNVVNAGGGNLPDLPSILLKGLAAP